MLCNVFKCFVMCLNVRQYTFNVPQMCFQCVSNVFKCVFCTLKITTFQGVKCEVRISCSVTSTIVAMPPDITARGYLKFSPGLSAGHQDWLMSVSDLRPQPAPISSC